MYFCLFLSHPSFLSALLPFYPCYIPLVHTLWHPQGLISSLLSRSSLFSFCPNTTTAPTLSSSRLHYLKCFTIVAQLLPLIEGPSPILLTFISLEISLFSKLLSFTHLLPSRLTLLNAAVSSQVPYQSSTLPSVLPPSFLLNFLFL